MVGLLNGYIISYFDCQVINDANIPARHSLSAELK